MKTKKAKNDSKNSVDWNTIQFKNENHLFSYLFRHTKKHTYIHKHMKLSMFCVNFICHIFATDTKSKNDTHFLLKTMINCGLKTLFFLNTEQIELMKCKWKRGINLQQILEKKINKERIYQLERNICSYLLS